MRTRRLIPIAIIAAVYALPTLSQPPTEVRVIVGDSWFKNDNEWETETFSELRDENGNLVIPSQSY